MLETTLVLLIVQFLIAAILWVATARPLRGVGRASAAASPTVQAWAAEPTRLVLPLLMVVAGLLFFSEPLAPVWGPALGLEAFGGVPPAVGRWSFLLLNPLVAGFVAAATGGVRHSPVLPLLIVYPALVWLVGVPLVEVGLAGMIVLGLILGAVRAEEETDPRRPRSLQAGQALIGVLSIVLLGATGWLSGGG